MNSLIKYVLFIIIWNVLLHTIAHFVLSQTTAMNLFGFGICIAQTIILWVL